MGGFRLPDPKTIFSVTEMVNYQVKLRTYLDNHKQGNTFDNSGEALIAGFDIQECSNQLVGSLVVFDTNSNIIEEVICSNEPTITYTPGLLGFREIPVFLECYQKLNTNVDLVVFDGFGVLHPRKMGLATQAAAYIQIPTFGVAKTPYIGEYTLTGTNRGDWTPITVNNQTLGAELRTQNGIKPVYVSVGWGIDLQVCIDVVLKFSNYRVPELTRQPDIRAREYCRNYRSIG